jgi:uncharacterized phiE125 gp8 family phage protein
MSISLITGPAIEPVTLSDLKLQCGLPPADDTDHIKEQMVAQRLRRHIRGARALCENFTRRVFITQTWQLQLDSWPYVDGRYHGGGSLYAQFVIPKPPLQSIQFVNYVDTDGNIQVLPAINDYGVGVNGPTYGYQLDSGSETQSARLVPAWARPWPPLRLVANAVMVQFKCGYGGPVTVATTPNSAILTGPVWNPGDVGQTISIPGAGAAGVTLSTTIASVDVNGQATMAVVATLAVVKATAYVGVQVPQPILDAILLAGQFLYDGNPLEAKLPPVITDMLSPYINRVS